MRNIHVIPTENYKQDYTTMRGEVIEVVRLGQLIRHKEVGEFLVNKNPQWAASCDTDILVPHHMYITSDEELKDGDWFLDIISNTIHRAKQATGFFNTRKKIILTTDQDLIKYGVQTIDDELLDACISVISYNNEKATKDSELNIPHEEPKPLKTMKNIHVLPTDQSSIFFIDNTGGYHFRKFFVPDTMQTFKNHNIYITSDEGLKEDDWFYDTIYESIFQWKSNKPKGDFQFKIILTTDQHLIKAGVQQIDIEFLEWFVKNPSCEFVWTDYDLYSPLGRRMDPHTLEQNLCGGKWKYIISIPQEEPKLTNNCPKCGMDLVEREGSKPICTRIDCGGIILSNETLKEFVAKNQEEPKQSVQEYEQQGMEKYSHELETQTTEQLPTKWFKTEEIETWIGKSITRITTDGGSIDESGGGRGKLIVLHQCGENKEELISQLETMIYGLKEGFDMFAN